MNNIDIDWYDIEEKIQTLQNPLSFIYIIIKKGNYLDEDLALLLRYFLKYHSNIAIQNNFLPFNALLSDFPLSVKIIQDFYYLSNKLNDLLFILKKIKTAYPKKELWKLNLINQIDYMKNLRQRFLAIYDCAIGPVTFQLKMKALLNTDVQLDIHINEMYERLQLTFRLLRYSFFINNNILIIDNFEFAEMSFINKIKYVEYVFMKINKILQGYINYFQLYESIRAQLENLLNPIPINIQIDLVQSEIESDDISFILGIK